MADIQFEEEQQFQRYGQTEQKPFMIRLVLSTGIVSTDNAAKYILLGIVGLGIIITLFIMFSGGRSSPPSVDQIIWVAGPDAIPGR